MKKNEAQDKVNAFAKFSSLGIQMGVIICLGVFSGQYLDEYFKFKTPWMTIICSLIGVFASLYIVLKGVINMNKNK